MSLIIDKQSFFLEWGQRYWDGSELKLRVSFEIPSSSRTKSPRRNARSSLRRVSQVVR